MSGPVPISDFEAVMAAIVGYATTAAAGLSTPITDVARGNPVPSGRCVRIWYGGEMPPPGMPGNRVLAGELIGEAVHLAAFWPFQGASGTTAAAAIDTDVRAFKHAFRTAILGHSTLGGIVTDLYLDHMTSDVFQAIDSTQYRTLEATLLLSFVEYANNP